jgi:hypothetical protein
MLAEGVAPWKAKAMYWAVSTFNSSWEEQPRVVTSEVCTPQATGETVCTLETRVETQTIEVPGPDLGDPTLRAVALSKFNAVARTLKTTDGAILDVGPFGSIDASPESIAANASNFSEILETNAFINDPSVLGILSGHTGHSFDRLEAWPGGTLPLYDVAPSFQSLTAGAPGFTLAPGDVEILTGDFDFSAHSFTIPAGE